MEPVAEAATHPPAADVITAFVWDGTHVLLAMRSDRVKTYPRHWAGISGYLEGSDALAWAFVEIAEETEIDRRHLTLRRIAEPLEVVDDALGLRFRVHPFLFQVADSPVANVNWEAATLQWVSLQDMLEQKRAPVVPQLYEAFQSVWPPWPIDLAWEANLRCALDWLGEDRRLGAGQLARGAAWELRKLIRLCPAEQFDELRPALADAAAQLRTARAAMAPLANLLAMCSAALSESKSPAAAARQVEQLIEASEAAESVVARRAGDEIRSDERLMTLSYSGTVLRTLLAAKDRLAGVYVCEARPQLEGRRLAAELHAAGIAVTLLTEAQVFAAMAEVDGVMLGADAILADGSVINKAGSALLALAAQHYGKPVRVVAESLKIVAAAEATDWPSEERPAEEVWPEAPAGVAILNRYFEKTPADLVASIITEQGVWQPGRVDAQPQRSRPLRQT